jgi:hypothetical protein
MFLKYCVSAVRNCFRFTTCKSTSKNNLEKLPLISKSIVQQKILDNIQNNYEYDNNTTLHCNLDFSQI